MSGLSLYRPYSNDDWRRHAEQAFEALLKNELDSVPKKTCRTGTGYAIAPQFSATVSLFDNSQLDPAAKIGMDQDADIAGDRSKVINLYGLSAAGAYQTEGLALNASNTTTKVESTLTYSKLYAAIPASALGASNIKVYETTGDAHLICTIPQSSAVGILATLLIPFIHGEAGDYSNTNDFEDDKGRFVHGGITAVYNITDDPTRVTNLLAVGMTKTDGILGGFSNGHSWATDKVILTTGAGSAKTYEVWGEYVPYQGVIDADDEYVLDWVDDFMYVMTLGTGGGNGVITTAYREYLAGMTLLPQTDGIADVTSTALAIDIAGLTDNAGAIARVPVMSYGATPRLVAGQTLVMGAKDAHRGCSAATIDGVTVNAYGPDLAGSVIHGCFLLAVGRQAIAALNADVDYGEPVLIVIGCTETSADTKVGDAIDVYRFTPHLPA